MTYADKAMQRLSDSLGATGVLSESYRRNIEGWAVAAIGQAYERGIIAEQSRVTDEVSTALAELDTALALCRLGSLHTAGHMVTCQAQLRGILDRCAPRSES